MVLFLRESIKKFKNNELRKLKLIPWSDFRQTIYDIYDHRIINAPEISGAMNNSYMGMDEHLLVYLLSIHQTRSETEF